MLEGQLITKHRGEFLDQGNCFMFTAEKEQSRSKIAYSLKNMLAKLAVLVVSGNLTNKEPLPPIDPRLIKKIFPKK